MKKVLLTLCILTLGLGMVIEDAEARRMGGGRSFGMQRNNTATPQRQATPPTAAPQQNAATPGRQQAAPGAPAATPKRSGWMGPIAGLAAGLGLAALASYLGFGEGLANFMMIALLAIVAVVVFRLIFRKAAPQQSAPLQYAGAGTPNTADAPPPSHFSGGSFTAPEAGTPEAATSSGSPIPADFDVPGFLRVAKVNFVRLQAAHDAGNLEDIREFTSPEVFAEIKLDMGERPQGSTQQTDVVTLEAELLGLETEENRYIASVRFHGMIREESESAAQPFNEIWHLTKPVSGNQGWTIAGIQQVQ